MPSRWRNRRGDTAGDAGWGRRCPIARRARAPAAGEADTPLPVECTCKGANRGETSARRQATQARGTQPDPGAAAHRQSDRAGVRGWTCCAAPSLGPRGAFPRRHCVRVGGGYLQLLPDGVSGRKPPGPGRRPVPVQPVLPHRASLSPPLRGAVLSEQDEPSPGGWPCPLYGEGCGCEVCICGGRSTEGTSLQVRQT